MFQTEGDGYAHRGLKNTQTSVVKWLGEFGLESDEQGLNSDSASSLTVSPWVSDLTAFVISMQWELSIVPASLGCHKD